MKTIKTLQQAYNLDKDHQVTLQELLNERTYISPKGWQPIKLDYEFRVSLCRMAADLYGGRQNTKDRVFSHLLYENRQHWGLSRTVLEDYGKGAKLKYIAGQDQTWENNAIRTALK